MVGAMEKRKVRKGSKDNVLIEAATEDFRLMLMEAKRKGVIDLRATDDAKLRAAIREAILSSPPVGLRIDSLIIPQKKTAEGVLIASTSIVWTEIVSRLSKNWNEAYQISSERWEELVAGAFQKAGYDEVTLTPRSGDFGRDVIAVKNGFGCVKIIGSVKAFAPNRRVGQDDVRALLGVLSGEQNASKGIIATTADFAPRLTSDPFVRPFLPTRLELVNGRKLRDWLVALANASPERIGR
jgi:restriction system protein